MLPEQHDILFSFIAILFGVFGIFVFGNVIQACREREGLNTTLWGGIFAGFALACFFDDGPYVRSGSGRSAEFFLRNLSLGSPRFVVHLGSVLQEQQN